MKKQIKKAGPFPTAAQDVADSGVTKQSNPAYRLAYDDVGFLLRDELRASRLQLEWLKPELTQEDYGIESTVVIFGSARIPDAGTAKKQLKSAQLARERQPENTELKNKFDVAKQILVNANYYQQARLLAKKITEVSIQHDGRHYVVVTGGGPGIMQAANQGAAEAGGISIGLNIVLPFEQSLNPFVTPELGFQFHYFAIRKMHFLKRARALVACPGGFGTLDELFETLTLIQTKKVKPLPVVLIGEAFWKTAVDFNYLTAQGVISPEDLELFHIVDTADAAWQILKSSWSLGD